MDMTDALVAKIRNEHYREFSPTVGLGITDYYYQKFLESSEKLPSHIKIVRDYTVKQMIKAVLGAYWDHIETNYLEPNPFMFFGQSYKSRTKQSHYTPSLKPHVLPELILPDIYPPAFLAAKLFMEYSNISGGTSNLQAMDNAILDNVRLKISAVEKTWYHLEWISEYNPGVFEKFLAYKKQKAKDEFLDNCAYFAYEMYYLPNHKNIENTLSYYHAYQKSWCETFWKRQLQNYLYYYDDNAMLCEPAALYNNGSPPFVMNPLKQGETRLTACNKRSLVSILKSTPFKELLKYQYKNRTESIIRYILTELAYSKEHKNLLRVIPPFALLGKAVMYKEIMQGYDNRQSIDDLMLKDSHNVFAKKVLKWLSLSDYLIQGPVITQLEIFYTKVIKDYQDINKFSRIFKVLYDITEGDLNKLDNLAVIFAKIILGNNFFKNSKEFKDEYDELQECHPVTVITTNNRYFIYQFFSKVFLFDLNENHEPSPANEPSPTVARFNQAVASGLVKVDNYSVNPEQAPSNIMPDLGKLRLKDTDENKNQNTDEDKGQNTDEGKDQNTDEGTNAKSIIDRMLGINQSEAIPSNDSFVKTSSDSHSSIFSPEKTAFQQLLQYETHNPHDYTVRMNKIDLRYLFPSSKPRTKTPYHLTFYKLSDFLSAKKLGSFIEDQVYGHLLNICVDDMRYRPDERDLKRLNKLFTGKKLKYTHPLLGKQIYKSDSNFIFIQKNVSDANLLYGDKYDLLELSQAIPGNSYLFGEYEDFKPWEKSFMIFNFAVHGLHLLLNSEPPTGVEVATVRIPPVSKPDDSSFICEFISRCCDVVSVDIKNLERANENNSTFLRTLHAAYILFYNESFGTKLSLPGIKSGWDKAIHNSFGDYKEQCYIGTSGNNRQSKSTELFERDMNKGYHYNEDDTNKSELPKKKGNANVCVGLVVKPRAEVIRQGKLYKQEKENDLETVKHGLSNRVSLEKFTEYLSRIAQNINPKDNEQMIPLLESLKNMEKDT